MLAMVHPLWIRYHQKRQKRPCHCDTLFCQPFLKCQNSTAWQQSIINHPPSQRTRQLQIQINIQHHQATPPPRFSGGHKISRDSFHGLPQCNRHGIFQLHPHCPGGGWHEGRPRPGMNEKLPFLHTTFRSYQFSPAVLPAPRLPSGMTSDVVPCIAQHHGCFSEPLPNLRATLWVFPRIFSRASLEYN